MAAIGEQMAVLKQCFQSWKSRVEKQQVTPQPESSVHTRLCRHVQAEHPSSPQPCTQTVFRGRACGTLPSALLHVGLKPGLSSVYWNEYMSSIWLLATETY